MQTRFIVANWKSYKNAEEAKSWIRTISVQPLPQDKTIIVCAPYTLLPVLHDEIASHQLAVQLGTQNISSFGEGAYTGEVTARQAKDFAAYTILGHSERRRYLHETNEDVLAKMDQAVHAGLTPILCMSDMDQLDYYLTHGHVLRAHAQNCIFVYEPPSAISGGGDYHPDDPEEVERIASDMQRKIGNEITVLYGGSLNADNASAYFALPHIKGGLIGQASLSAEQLLKIIAL